MEVIYLNFAFSFLILISRSTCKEIFRFASHYESHMVLQKAPQHALLWGYGQEYQTVAVQLDDVKIYHTTTYKGSDGLSVWRVILDPVSFGGPHHIIATSMVDRKKIVLNDVLFGDVWLCGGQSNMAFTVGMSLNASKEIANAGKYPNIRLFTVRRYLSTKPLNEIDENNILQHWSIASQVSVGGKDNSYFSAVCWLYGRKLYDLYKVPIGLISSNYGGTCIEPWSSPHALKKCNMTKSHDELDKKEWKNNRVDKNSYSVLWNAMIHPLINTTITGVIWYQGESNTLMNSDEYNCTFPAMIKDWREQWFEGTQGNTECLFPFGFVQIASIGTDYNLPLFPLIRWQQMGGYSNVPNPNEPNVFMAVTMDLPDDKSTYGSIHPRDKTTVADRLILGARAIAYKENVTFQGPIIDTCLLINNQGKYLVKVMYKAVGAKGILLRSKTGFEILTKDSPIWVPIVVLSTTSDNHGILLKVTTKDVIAVRYAWQTRPCNYKQCAIYSVVNSLPAPPSICDLV